MKCRSASSHHARSNRARPAPRPPRSPRTAPSAAGRARPAGRRSRPCRRSPCRPSRRARAPANSRRASGSKPSAERQPRPLEPVARRRAVGPERVRGVVAVVVRQRPPARVEVLDHAHAADEPLRDPHRPLVHSGSPVATIASTPCMFALAPAVGLEPRPVAVPHVDQRARGLIPEARVEHLQRLAEQLLDRRRSPPPARRRRARRRACRPAARLREPAAVLGSRKSSRSARSPCAVSSASAGRARTRASCAC